MLDNDLNFLVESQSVFLIVSQIISQASHDLIPITVTYYSSYCGTKQVNLPVLEEAKEDRYWLSFWAFEFRSREHGDMD